MGNEYRYSIVLMLISMPLFQIFNCLITGASTLIITLLTVTQTESVTQSLMYLVEKKTASCILMKTNEE